MELLRRQRLKIGNWILAGKIGGKQRKPFYAGINGVRNIGIVWDASNTGDFPALSRFHLQMQERKINVKILGYYPEPELPDQYTAIRYLSCIRRKELNYFYIPGSTETDVFINTKFDVLIDINFNKVFPLIYITSLSKSLFRVGLFTTEQESAPYDLMMEMKMPVSIDNYLEQIIRYLEMIKPDSPDNIVNQ
ncbi:MAG TPA: hypothetical protein PLV06_06870 [Bacteroidales bacterium]|nr:hypothetical protein [Bacteroidales bacterium]HPJ59550.1 hypothetical protein [Bacteroidales bacterium]HPR12087.1 hypothetical protein [Bacteroidales bacterium]HRW85287.1 hypothetical protein [Bacteroidales bacterium]